MSDCFLSLVSQSCNLPINNCAFDRILIRGSDEWLNNLKFYFGFSHIVNTKSTHGAGFIYF